MKFSIHQFAPQWPIISDLKLWTLRKNAWIRHELEVTRERFTERLLNSARAQSHQVQSNSDFCRDYYLVPFIVLFLTHRLEQVINPYLNDPSSKMLKPSRILAIQISIILPAVETSCSDKFFSSFWKLREITNFLKNHSWQEITFPFAT